MPPWLPRVPGRASSATGSSRGPAAPGSVSYESVGTCAAWGRSLADGPGAGNIAPDSRRDWKVYVEGTLRNREYTGKDGAKVKEAEITLQRLILLSPKKDADRQPTELTRLRKCRRRQRRRPHPHH